MIKSIGLFIESIISSIDSALEFVITFTSNILTQSLLAQVAFSVPRSILVQHTLDRSIPYLTSMQSACLNQLPEVKFGFLRQRILTCQINSVTILVSIWQGHPGLSLIFFIFKLSKPSFWRLQAFLLIPDACAAYLSMHIVYKPLTYCQQHCGKPFLLIL